MQTALAGTQDQEKEYTFTTPLEHGLSYRLLNPESQEFRKTLVSCYDLIDMSAKKSHAIYDLPTYEMLRRCLENKCDVWVSVDAGSNIVGCCTIGVETYGPISGINLESTSGKWVRRHVMPIVENYYKNLGFTFVEISGRKGWERALSHMGYKLSKITIHKEL
jgi:hypothetical protein|tara:strand:+ start:3859 stop:4347 length:489 start_codon:yes stop_codon:yes gene_type:complete